MKMQRFLKTTHWWLINIADLAYTIPLILIITWAIGKGIPIEWCVVLCIAAFLHWSAFAAAAFVVDLFIHT
jgi:hypothetical protein